MDKTNLLALYNSVYNDQTMTLAQVLPLYGQVDKVILFQLGLCS